MGLETGKVRCFQICAKFNQNHIILRGGLQKLSNIFSLTDLSLLLVSTMANTMAVKISDQIYY